MNISKVCTKINTTHGTRRFLQRAELSLSDVKLADMATQLSLALKSKNDTKFSGLLASLGDSSNV